MQSLTPYLIIFVLCLTGSSIFFPNCELTLVALSAVEVVKPFYVFGIVIDPANYQAGSPLLLAVCGAAGSAVGSCLFYFVGRGARGISSKLKKQLEKFDFEKFAKSGVVITYTSSAFSLPPFTILSLAAGMTRYPLWQYLLISLVGKTTRFAIVAYTGGTIVRVIADFARGLF